MPPETPPPSEASASPPPLSTPLPPAPSTALFDTAFAKVSRLSAEFAANETFYRSPDYQEAEARRDFIDKFFIALGWDVNHETQKNPYAQEVKVERREQGPSQRRADYAFYLAPNYLDVRFYVEAKKPFGDIATPDNYFQTIRYGWNSKTPIAVLTDFEQFEIVDCRFKPVIETALQRNLKKFTYRDYTNKEKFAEIYYLFSHEAVAEGALEKYAKVLPKKRGAAQKISPKKEQTIDEVFLEELEKLRLTLASMFKSANPELNGTALTELTQCTLDRLIFMRFLEDKFIESERMVSNFEKAKSPWKSFIATSARLDKIYNGIIFKENEILDKKNFVIHEGKFCEVCRVLSNETSPYNFATIPIHILGSIYEQFLGKVIVATDKRARIEAKPELRKEDGVYYTPEHVVRRIVENTVGKIIAGKTPEQIAGMRFADIACGSGSFLIGVYELLLNYHGTYYNRYPKRAKNGETLKGPNGILISMQKKREILVNNIFGVDIDTQAVEVAQLSLYLKLLQDETPGSVHQFLLDFEKQALLPTLNKNIICGNSLIGRDILTGELFSTEQEGELNPMNFQIRFPEVTRHGGFDAIVGNPPYGAAFSKAEINYFQNKFKFQAYKLDSYLLFVEQSLSVLKTNGIMGMIIPNTWLLNLLSPQIRKAILAFSQIENIVHYQFPVFKQATVNTEIVVFKKKRPAPTHTISINIVEKNNTQERYSVSQKRWQDANGKPINIFEKTELTGIVDKLRKLEKLDDICFITQGCKPFQTGKGKPAQTEKIVQEKPFISEKKKDSTFRPLLRGSLMNRYQINWHENYWISFGDWLAEPRYSANYDAEEKIVIRQTGDSLVATLDRKQFVVRDNLYTILPNRDGVDLRVILALINSNLLNWFYQNILNPEKGEALAQVKRGHLADLPVFNSKKRNNELLIKKLGPLVEEMLVAKEQLLVAKTNKDKSYYGNKSDEIGDEIDALVYELYGLTADEIAIVEEGTK